MAFIREICCPSRILVGIFIIFGLSFADSTYVNGDLEESASTERTLSDSKQKSSILHIIDWGSARASYVIGTSYKRITFGLGAGIEAAGEEDSPLFIFLLHYEFLNSNNKRWFFGSKVGIGEYKVFNPFIGFLIDKPKSFFDRWSFALGWGFYDIDLPADALPLTLKASYQFRAVSDSSNNYLDIFRLGLGADIALWQQDSVSVNLDTPFGDWELNRELNLELSEKISEKYYSKWEEYLVVGLDVDITEHFGIGGKFLLPDAGNKIKTAFFRTSIYFAF